MFRSLPESLFANRPVMQDRRIKIRAIGPDQRVNLGIDLDPLEYRELAQGTV